MALAIACVGLYGGVSYNVARRTGEIGIRMALGGTTWHGRVVRMVLREVLVMAAGGLAIGMAPALGTSKFVASFLYGMKANDPLRQFPAQPSERRDPRGYTTLYRINGIRLGVIGRHYVEEIQVLVWRAPLAALAACAGAARASP